MRRIVTGLFMSLDGVVEADDDWQFAYFDDEFIAWISAGMERTGAALMGRRSYQGYDRLRSEHPDSPMVAFLNSVPKYVASTTLDDVDWPGTTVIRGDVRKQVTDLKHQDGKDIVVFGSPTLVRWLLRNDLLDELAFTVLSIIVGSGVRLFEDMDVPADPIGLEAQRVRQLTSGVVELSYAPAHPRP